MDERELDLQIEGGKSLIAKAEKLIADSRSLYEETGVGRDLFAEVLASDNFTKEFKDFVKVEREKALAKIAEQAQQHATVKSSKIATHTGVTRI